MTQGKKMKFQHNENILTIFILFFQTLKINYYFHLQIKT